MIHPRLICTLLCDVRSRPLRKENRDLPRRDSSSPPSLPYPIFLLFFFLKTLLSYSHFRMVIVCLQLAIEFYRATCRSPPQLWRHFTPIYPLLKMDTLRVQNYPSSPRYIHGPCRESQANKQEGIFTGQEARLGLFLPSTPAFPKPKPSLKEALNPPGFFLLRGSAEFGN
ncbi:hypothetical protein F4820DRAFT_133365 [Hypoxylon rubiginosum]|uniref:Uncharacterized protein n=1 Tax=Hypoxylon rubiginosum TaxID=110542 RepID=A0ACB9YL07_9PEZI|nr:hypothetical protein F4820DRAFT_133365 [Hypoxylon rubiginosum]